MYHKMPLFDNYQTKKINKNSALSSGLRASQTLEEASYDTYPHKDERTWQCGSITLEMVVVLPLFISFMVFFLFLFRVLLVQETMEEALVYASRTLAVNCYEETEKEQKSQAALLAEAELTLRKGLTESACPVNYIRGGAMGISLLQSELAGDDVTLRASYEMRLPCVLLGTYDLHFVQCVQSRKWIGDRSLEQGEDADDTWVYITPYGTVYHRDRTCRYLDLTIHAVDRKSLLTLRNADRKIYRKCEDCGGGANGCIYVTDYGDRYHSSLSCSGLKRTIYMVKLLQAGGRNACSKCGAGQS